VQKNAYGMRTVEMSFTEIQFNRRRSRRKTRRADGQRGGRKSDDCTYTACCTFTVIRSDRSFAQGARQGRGPRHRHRPRHDLLLRGYISEWPGYALHPFLVYFDPAACNL